MKRTINKHIAKKVDSYRAKCELQGLRERGLPMPSMVLVFYIVQRGVQWKQGVVI